jgi:hypothetical protein
MSNPEQERRAPPRQQRPSDAQTSDTTHVTDIALAELVVRALSDAPGGARLIAGRGAAVTYGPHERIEGVVIHHHPTGQMALEVHVAIAESAALERVSSARPALLELAEEVRGAIERAMRGAGLPAPAEIDVHIDDLWRPETGATVRGAG